MLELLPDTMKSRTPEALANLMLGAPPIDCATSRALTPPSHLLSDVAQQLSLQDELALFVLLAGFVSFVVFPAHCLLALSTRNVSDYVFSRSHCPFVGFSSNIVDDVVEEISFSMLTPEVLRQSARWIWEGFIFSSNSGATKDYQGAHPTDDIFVVRKMGFAILASIDLITV